MLETSVTAQGSGLARDPKQALLSEIVEQMNEIFEGELSDADVITYAEGIRDKALEDREVTLQARNNVSLDQFANGKIKQVIPRAIWEMRTAHESMTNQVMSDSETMKRFAEVITRMVYEAVNEGA